MIKSKLQINEEMIKANAGKVVGRINKNFVMRSCGKCGEPFQTLEKKKFIYCNDCMKKKNNGSVGAFE